MNNLIGKEFNWHAAQLDLPQNHQPRADETIRSRYSNQT
jgi:hypothetical protein